MRQIARACIGLVLFIAIGAVGFRITEGWDWLQCTYQAVIIMTTVGLSATSQTELQPATKVFIIAYLMVTIGLFSYTISVIGQRLINLELHGLLEKRRMERQLAVTRDHFIVCGYGRMGQTICQYLQSRGKPFVIIDNNDERLAEIRQQERWLYVRGDATDDAVLKQAGIERAKSLATVLPTDADNVYVTLTARLHNERLQIIARASDEKAVTKLQRAGASRVVSPFSSGAVKMARFMLNPSIEDFLEVTDAEGSQLELADVGIQPGSPFVGRKLLETDLQARGVMIIGIRRANGDRLMPPRGSDLIEAGDSLFAFGSAAAVNWMITAAAERE
jgi:voltage-gated potassium channel